MKKSGVFISVMAAAALWVSCGTEAVEDRNGERTEIGFSTLLTRGIDITGASTVASSDGFSVWAYKHTGDWATAADKTIMIDNAGSFGHVTSTNGTEWNYGTPQHWPLAQKVSFFAYAPHGYAAWTGETIDINGVPIITCDVPAAVGSQKDLLFAAPVYNATGPDPVKEVFRHALSRITFSALKAEDMRNMEVKIKSITLEKIHPTGTASLLIPVVWTVDDGEYETYGLSTTTGGGLKDVSLTVETAQDLASDDGILFLMPQELDPEVKLTVKFTIGSWEFDWSCPLPGPDEWLAGKAYNYKLLVDGETVVIICGGLEPLIEDEWNKY